MSTHPRAWRGALIYLVLGALWIYASDDLLAYLVPEREALLRYQTWKGTAYVVLTALMAWLLLRRESRTEGDLRETQAELADTIALAQAGIALVGLDGRLLRVNPRFAEIVGRPQDEAQGLRFQDITHPDDLDGDLGLVADLLAGRRDSYKLEKRYLRPGGSSVWVLLSVSLQRHPDGTPRHFISVVQDITPLKQNQQALAASEARLRAVVAALPDLIFLFDARGVIVDLWASDERKLLAPRARVIDQPVAQFLPPRLAQRAQACIDAVLAGHGAQLIEYSLHLNGTDHWFEMRMARTGEREVLAIARDITAEREARAALQRSETSLRLAIEGSGDALWDWDLLTNQVVFGAAFERALRYQGSGTAAGEFVFRDRLHPDDRQAALAAVRQAIHHGQPFNAAFRLACFDGVYRWFQARGICHRDGDNRPCRFAGVMTDLTERLRAEERLQLAAQVLDSTQEGVMITDADGLMISVNRAFTTLLGYTEAEVVGRNPRMLSSGRHDRAYFAAMWDQLARTGHWQGELWNRRKDGELIPELMSISTVRDARQKITHYVGVFADISGLKDSEARLEFLAHHDPLTRLPNRLLFNNRLDQALHQARRDHQRLAVLLLDLDRFKDINDSYGHLAGDELLQHVAQRLSQRLRHADTLARLGGDEFAVLMHDLHHDDDAARLADELLASLGQPWRSSEGVEASVGVSIGICIFPDNGTTPQALLQGADAALYRAKEDGRGLYRYYADEMTQAARERLHIEARLRRALADDHLVLHYQPQVDLHSGRIIGVEALVRWQDPEQGMIPPARFIPMAETTGLIADIGAWVLRHACHQAKAWIDAGLPPLTMAVNVSPRQFHLADLAAQVADVLADTGLPASRLELELTEGALMEREHEALQVLQRLRAMGVGLAIDDFGTGYSSLASLKRFPIDVLKIDRSFIADIPADPDDMEIASAIIAMGHSLGIRVLAEGVETSDQLDFLGLKKCDRYQGFLRSRPLPGPALATLLEQEQARHVAQPG